MDGTETIKSTDDRPTGVSESAWSPQPEKPVPPTRAVLCGMTPEFPVHSIGDAHYFPEQSHDYIGVVYVNAPQSSSTLIDDQSPYPIPSWVARYLKAAFAPYKETIRKLRADLHKLSADLRAAETCSNQLLLQLKAALVAAEQTIADLRRRLAAVEETPQPAPDNSVDAVQRRVEGVIDDLVAGRTTPAQRSGLTTATERAGRIQPASDTAVGRVILGQ